MKRGASASTAPEPEATRRRRQPQISCNFCRSKKLKCDRAQPCFNCRSRGIACDGQQTPQQPSPQQQDEQPASFSQQNQHDAPDILERLRRLEDAVFGPTASSPKHQDDTPASSSATRPVITQRDRSAELDYNKPGDPRIFQDSIRFTFRMARDGEYSRSTHSETRCIDFPSLDDAAKLFHDYFDASDFHVAAILHPPSFHSSMVHLFAQLRDDQAVVDTGAAALALAVCAAAAFYWDQDLPFLFNFQSEQHAAAQSHTWRTAAWDILDQSQRCASNNLETIQARLVLSDLIYNMEGITARFRYMHSCARAAAYEARLHLIDLPGCESTDGPILKEMKRRIWWYSAGTDWLCCTTGGAMDRVYTVRKNHFCVNYPKFLPDANEVHGLWSESAVVHMMIRIRIGEICRDIADTLPFGSGDIDTVPYSTIVELDRKFEDILKDLPALNINSNSFTPTNDAATNQSQKLAIQRAIGTLSLHARRARLLRPLLQVKDLAPKFHTLRRTCFQSVEAVLDIASKLLSHAVDTPASSSFNVRGVSAAIVHRSPHRSGLVINHLFMACAVLATDPSLRVDAPRDAETKSRRAQVENACHLLKKAGEKSAMASDMLKRLVSVLRKHRVQGLEVLASAATIVPRTAEPPQQPQQHQQVPTPIAMMQQTTAEAYPLSGVTSGPGKDEANVFSNNNTWGYYAGVDPNGLNDIWNDFLGTFPKEEGWGQLFADLDYMSYGM